jgi:hypothetical protein
VWPAFRGRDLVTLCPGITLEDWTMDGATTAGVLEEQIPRATAASPSESILVTLTAGGNDLLQAVGASQAEGDRAVGRALLRLNAIVDAVHTRMPGATLLVSTVYDPTDGTGKLEHVQLRDVELGWLRAFNAAVRALCHGPVRLADLHARFLGHGLSAPPPERWYWSLSSIEPGLIGASEVRRTWLDAIA